jgi:hypothetical protein
MCPESILPYLEEIAQSLTDTKIPVHDEKDVRFTPRQRVHPYVTGSRIKSSGSPLIPNTVELTCPARPPPDPQR